MVKLYKFNRFFAKNKKRILTATGVVVAVATVCVMINNLVFGLVLTNLAEMKKNTGKYNTATALYNTASTYYKYINFTKSNKKHYIVMQYNLALCNLEEYKFDEADAAIREGMYQMLDAYGLESFEYADYVRNSVVEYYIKRQNFQTASEYLVLAEYLSMKQKSSSSEIANIKRLYGDLYYKMLKIKNADAFYQDAYRLSQKFTDTDAEEMIKIVDRVADMYIRNKQIKEATSAYAKLVDNLNKKNYNNKAQYAVINWHTARALAQDSQNEKALTYYLSAYDVVRTLPPYYAIKQDINILRSEMSKIYTAMGLHSASEKMTKEIQKSLKK